MLTLSVRIDPFGTTPKGVVTEFNMSGRSFANPHVDLHSIKLALRLVCSSMLYYPIDGALASYKVQITGPFLVSV